MDLRLGTPDAQYWDSWDAARAEWPPGSHQDGSGLRLARDVRTPADFAEWTEALRRQADPAITPPPGEVHTTFLWIMSGSEFLGSIDLRHHLNDFLAEAGGHIGYSVRPTARGAGVATWALQATLPLAAGLGLSRVLLTCDPDNQASRRTIENSGGILEGRRATSIGPKLRFWIDLGASANPSACGGVAASHTPEEKASDTGEDDEADHSQSQAGNRGLTPQNATDPGR